MPQINQISSNLQKISSFIISGIDHTINMMKNHAFHNIRNLKQVQCNQQCQKTGSIVGGAISGALIAIFLITLLIALTKKGCWKRCLLCPCHKFQKLKKIYNKGSEPTISQQSFKLRSNRLVFLINSCKTFHVSHDSKNYVTDVHCQIVKESRYLIELEFVGKDHLGSWTGIGYITSNADCQFFLWFYKQYEDRQFAGQVGEYSHIIFSSKDIRQDEVSGKWCFLGFEYESKYSGTWVIKQQYGNKTQQFGNKQLSLVELPQAFKN